MVERVPLVTSGEFAQALGVGWRTLVRWIRAGKVAPPLGPEGGRRVWTREVVDAELARLGRRVPGRASGRVPAPSLDECLTGEERAALERVRAAVGARSGVEAVRGLIREAEARLGGAGRLPRRGGGVALSPEERAAAGEQVRALLGAVGVEGGVVEVAGAEEVGHG